ncbi:hypothetical protein AGMMS50230_05310 [Spirochaetia bacterium]|nr:hypothetical protein AGMMS50230_05310 [Spirochaetia bacterium]
MKKALIVVLFAAMIASAAFAAPPALKMSAGGGVLFAGDLGGGMKIGSTDAYKTPWFGPGAFAFFDATYAEVGVDFIYGFGTMSPTGGSDEKYKIMNLGFSLLGKYPFTFGKITAFPLLGIEYRFAVSAKDKNGDNFDKGGNGPKAADFSALWIQIGGGVDYPITKQLYVRGELLYGIRLQNKAEKDSVDEAKRDGDDAKRRWGHGPTIKIGVGYKF